MYSSHVLLKFIKKKEHVEDFLNGNFYMNTLYNFGEKMFEDARRKREALIKANPEKNPDDITVKMYDGLSVSQSDTLEGVVGYGSNALFEPIFGDNLLSDCIYQAVGFQYCNVLCFYRWDYISSNLFLRCEVPNIADFRKEFGDFVIIIKDKQELLRRIDAAIRNTKYFYGCGDVEYRTFMKDGSETYIGNKSYVLLNIKRDTLANIRDMRLENGDCFTKFDKYAWQNEWRVALYRGKKDTSAYTLRVGDVRDIAYSIRTDELISELIKMYVAGDIKPSKKGYFGNVSRAKLRRKFYKLGGKKANMFLLFGGEYNGYIPIHHDLNLLRKCSTNPILPRQ